jgi:hypothetical protein
MPFTNPSFISNCYAISYPIIEQIRNTTTPTEAATCLQILVDRRTPAEILAFN